MLEQSVLTRVCRALRPTSCASRLCTTSHCPASSVDPPVSCSSSSRSISAQCPHKFCVKHSQRAYAYADRVGNFVAAGKEHVVFHVVTTAPCYLPLASCKPSRSASSELHFDSALLLLLFTMLSSRLTARPFVEQARKQHTRSAAMECLIEHIIGCSLIVGRRRDAGPIVGMRS